MAVSLHETCQEYFDRRIREGWKCVSLEGYNAVLLSPEGIRRELDLRNDVETLRPNAPGAEENIAAATSGAGNHWQDVDEEVADDTTTRLKEDRPDCQWYRDFFNIEDHTVGNGTINKITLYFRVRTGAGNNGNTTAIGVIKSGTTVAETAERNPYYDFGNNVFGTYSAEWTKNPEDNQAWEWDDIDNLQIGVSLRTCVLYTYAFCTQVYVEVDYTPPAIGKSYGYTIG